jgi:hypothetical protein
LKYQNNIGIKGGRKMKGKKREKLLFGAIGFFLILAVMPATASAGVPAKINYQGFLTNDGTPVDTEGVPVQMTFRIYCPAGSPVADWFEIQQVEVSNGIFNVTLNINPDIFIQDPQDTCDLGVQVAGESNEMSPRKQITSVPFSIRTGRADSATTAGYTDTAGNADTVDGEHADAFADSSHDHSAANITAGTLDAARYSAYSDLGSEGYLDNNATSDILIRSQTDARYIRKGGDTMNGSLNIKDGSLRVRNQDNTDASSVSTLDWEGRVVLFGHNGSLRSWNVFMGSTGSYSGKGKIAVCDDSIAITEQASMYVDGSNNGVVQADVKNFRVPNPNQPGTEIVYASVEGPEAAAYVRGTASLISGKAVINLPDHFRAVAVEEGITVQVTPLSSNSKGLAVVKKSLQEGISIQELADGQGNYDFDYHIVAVRKGYEDYQVIQPELSFNADNAEE